MTVLTHLKKATIARFVAVCVVSFLFFACEKFVEITQLETKILAEQVFQDQAMADAAIAGLYKSFKVSIPVFFTVNSSLYVDDIVPYLNSAADTYYTNDLQPNNSSLPWSRLYGIIYGANSAIGKLENSGAIAEPLRNQYIAEAKFMRAMSHFYLVNFFGDVPLVLTSDVNTNKAIARTPVAQVYVQIIADLKDAKAVLGDDYNHAASQRVRANKGVASAMLARAYLFLNDYPNSEAEAEAVISSGDYSLLTTPAGIWNKNNTEAILQLANNSTEGNSGVATRFLYTSTPTIVITQSLLDAFESGDLRKTTWLRSQMHGESQVSVPFKMTTSDTNPPEYYTLIRLAEMYLIRAEARAMRDDFVGCADDVNLIRSQHGGLATPLADPTTREAAMTMILQERRVEFFTEGCHRFFDLKRTGRTDAVLNAEKPTYWKSTAALYPIPLDELQRNPLIKENNPGYE